MKRRLAKLLVFLLLGAIVNVAVAWMIGGFLNPRMHDATEHTGSGPGEWRGIEGGDYWAWIVIKHSTPCAVRTISRWNDKGTGGGGSGGWPDAPAAPLIPKWARQLSPENSTPCRSYHYCIAWEYGWPKRSVGGLVHTIHRLDSRPKQVTVDSHFAFPLETELLNDPNTHWEVKLLVFRPLWPGFAINTICYAAILWMLVAAPFAFRRWRRIKRGLCPGCAYPVGESAECTECGKPVPLPLSGRVGKGVEPTP